MPHFTCGEQNLIKILWPWLWMQIYLKHGINQGTKKQHIFDYYNRNLNSGLFWARLAQRSVIIIFIYRRTLYLFSTDVSLISRTKLEIFMRHQFLGKCLLLNWCFDGQTDSIEKVTPSKWPIFWPILFRPLRFDFILGIYLEKTLSETNYKEKMDIMAPISLQKNFQGVNLLRHIT